jgi:hypothetical protein
MRFRRSISSAISWVGLLDDHSGERVLLDPYLDVVFGVVPEIAPVCLGEVPDSMAQPGIGDGTALPSRIVGNPLERDDAFFPHIAEEAAYGAVVFLLRLLDEL